jgi:hypothetical protein
MVHRAVVLQQRMRRMLLLLLRWERVRMLLELSLSQLRPRLLSLLLDRRAARGIQLLLLHFDALLLHLDDATHLLRIVQIGNG